MISMSEPVENKRATVRVETSGITAKLIMGQEKSAQECVVSIRDFSIGGASLYTNFKANAASPLKMMLEGIMPGWVDGVVAWCTPAQGDDQAPPGATFRMGISFRPKDRAAQASLAAAFEHISRLADEADELDNEA